MYGRKSWTIKKAEHQRTDALELWCLRVPWTAKRSNQSIVKEINPEYSLEGLMLKLNFNTLATWCEQLTHWKRPWFWGRLKAGEERDNRGWDGWMASPTWWTWVWTRWTGKLVMHREAWHAAVHGVAKSQTRQSDWTELNWKEIKVKTSWGQEDFSVCTCTGRLLGDQKGMGPTP